MKEGKRDLIVLNIIAYVFIGIIALAAVIPFIILISSSLQSEAAVVVIDDFNYFMSFEEFSKAGVKGYNNINSRELIQTFIKGF